MGNRSDTDQKSWFQEVLKTIKGVDIASIKTDEDGVDVVAIIGGKKKYFELKTTEKSDKELKEKAYFGAASITEWKCAIDHPDDFYFVYIKGTNKEDFKYLLVKVSKVFQFATIPPFAINLNVKFKDYLEDFKALSDDTLSHCRR